MDGLLRGFTVYFLFTVVYRDSIDNCVYNERIHNHWIDYVIENKYASIFLKSDNTFLDISFKRLNIRIPSWQKLGKKIISDTIKNVKF